MFHGLRVLSNFSRRVSRFTLKPCGLSGFEMFHGWQVRQLCVLGSRGFRYKVPNFFAFFEVIQPMQLTKIENWPSNT